jgi:hypothetical protein
MVLQVVELFLCQLYHKVSWEPLIIPFDRAHQHLWFDAIEHARSLSSMAF